MNFKFLIYAVCFVLLSACNEISKKDLTNLIESNQEKWESANINSYTYTYYSFPIDCPNVDPFPAVEISVENNIITELYVPDLGVSLDLSYHSYPTMDDIFNNMIDSVEDIQSTPFFNVILGYPTNYETDMSSSECDGYSIQISSFI